VIHNSISDSHCAKSILNEGKMRSLQFGFYNIRNHCRKPKLEKYFTPHGVLLTYQPTSSADPAQVGRNGCADWQVTQKDIVQFEFFSLILAFYD